MRTYLIIALCVLAINSFAQNKSKYDDVYVYNKLWNDWFVSAGGGINVYYGTDDSKLGFSDRFAPAIDISVGKWLHPNFGVRLQYAGIKTKGYVMDETEPAYYHFRSDENNGQEFNVFNIHTDALFNISNILGDYRIDRLIEIKPFVGFGYTKSYVASESYFEEKLCANVGLINSVRLSDRFDLNLEIRDMMVSHRFDGEYNDNYKVENLASLTMGITFRFDKVRKKFNTLSRVKSELNSKYIDDINHLQQQVSTVTQENDSLLNELLLMSQKLDNQSNTTMDYSYDSENQQFSGLKILSVFFQIGQANLSDKTIVNLSQVAEFINTTKTAINIIGYGDIATGSKKRNKELSYLRSQAVYDELVNTYHVDKDLISIQKGDIEKQPYNKNVLNRVVIFSYR